MNCTKNVKKKICTRVLRSNRVNPCNKIYLIRRISVRCGTRVYVFATRCLRVLNYFSRCELIDRHATRARCVNYPKRDYTYSRLCAREDLCKNAAVTFANQSWSKWAAWSFHSCVSRQANSLRCSFVPHAGVYSSSRNDILSARCCCICIRASAAVNRVRLRACFDR